MIMIGYPTVTTPLSLTGQSTFVCHICRAQDSSTITLHVRRTLDTRIYDYHRTPNNNHASLTHKEHISGFVGGAQFKYAYHFGHSSVSICVNLYVPNPRGHRIRSIRISMCSASRGKAIDVTYNAECVNSWYFPIETH